MNKIVGLTLAATLSVVAITVCLFSQSADTRADTITCQDWCSIKMTKALEKCEHEPACVHAVKDSYDVCVQKCKP
jgi:hypothetical protein